MSMPAFGAGRRLFRWARTLSCSLAVLAVVSVGRVDGEIATETVVGPAAILAQADEPELQAAPPPPESPVDEASSPEKKRKARSAAVLLSVLAGIALTGLLLIILSVCVRGLQRKLAGPTRIDHEPQDILPDVASPGEDSQQPAEPPDDADAAEDETQYT